MVTRNKVKCSIRVDEEVYRVAQERSKRREIPLAEVLADAAHKHLLGHKTDEHVLLGLVQQLIETEYRDHVKVFYEFHVLKEMLGVFIRAFVRAVPVPASGQSEESERASLVRYDQIMEEVAQHIRQRQSDLEQQLALLTISAKPDSVQSSVPATHNGQPAESSTMPKEAIATTPATKPATSAISPSTIEPSSSAVPAIAPSRPNPRDNQHSPSPTPPSHTPASSDKRNRLPGLFENDS